jgi:hypothetical protein
MLLKAGSCRLFYFSKFLMNLLIGISKYFEERKLAKRVRAMARMEPNKMFPK